MANFKDFIEYSSNRNIFFQNDVWCCCMEHWCTKQWNIKTKSWVKIEYFVFKYTKKYIEWNWNRGRKRIITDVLVWKMLLMSNPSLFHKDSISISVWKCNSKMKVLVTIQYVCHSSHHNNVILNKKDTIFEWIWLVTWSNLLKPEWLYGRFDRHQKMVSYL